MLKVHVKLFVESKCHCWNQGYCCHSGARIADNYKIKKGKIRGMESLGKRFVSLRTWDFQDSIIPKEFADGIQILPEDAVPGDSIFLLSSTLTYEIIELSITPNRADAFLCVVNRRSRRNYGKSVHFPEKQSQKTVPASDKISVANERWLPMLAVWLRIANVNQVHNGYKTFYECWKSVQSTMW